MKKDRSSIATAKTYSHFSELNYSTLRPNSSKAFQQDEIKSFVDTRYRGKTTDVDMSFRESLESREGIFFSIYPYESVSTK